MNQLLNHPILLSLFFAPKISLDSISKINEQIRPIAYYAMPVIIVCAILELIVQRIENDKTKYAPIEAITSFMVGLGYLASSYFTKAILFASIVLFYNFIPWRMEFHWWLFLPCYILHDFSSYWRHRITHQSRFWWAIHIPHHNANHYNLWINFRQSWFEQLCVVFYLPLLLVGFHPLLYFMVHQLNAILQFWVHTEYIGKLPKWFEYIFVTPTSHKVHHASNEKYLNKNYGNTFIIWDRMFGTFQEMDEKPVYGLVKPVYTNNILHIVFDEAVDIFKDVRNAKSWKEKIWLAFGSPAKIAAAKNKKISANTISQ